MKTFEELGLSKEVVKYRIDNLVKNGVIIRFYTLRVERLKTYSQHHIRSRLCGRIDTSMWIERIKIG